MKCNEKFSGYINICGVFFNASVDKHLCSIFPQYPFVDNTYQNPLPDKVNELAELTSLKGVYGIEPANFKAQFLDFITESKIPAKLLVTKMPKARYQLTSEVSSYQFYAPIVIKPQSAPIYSLDLSFFDAITFSGESVNLAYNPKFAVEPDDKWFEKLKATPGAVDITIKPFEEYTKTFDMVMAGVSAKLTYSVVAKTDHMNLTNNNLGALNSLIRVTFDEKQPLEMIQKCYVQLLHFLQFLLGRQNVGFNVSLQQKIKNMSPAARQLHGDEDLELFSKVAEVFISDGYEDYCNIRVDHTIQLSHLGKDLPKLLNLFAENGKRPFLQMLPLTNNRVGTISYTDVGDICTSLEIEYNLKGYTTPQDCVREGLIEKLKETVKAFRNEVKITDTALWDSANNSVKYINLPLKERIIYLWEASLDEIEIIDDNKKQKLKEDIATFIKMRNNITHTGKIEWPENHTVYITLLRTLYFSILVRAGFSSKDAKNIARQKFQYDNLMF